MKRDMLLLSVSVALLFASLAAGRLLGGDRAEVAAASVQSSGGCTLVLDAGHGGEDGGAVAASGAKESDINLEIVLRLDQLMGFCGVPAVLTRDGDYAIYDKTAATLHEKKVSDIRNRVELIEGLDDAVVLSVHQNSFTDPRYSGAQVFYRETGDSRRWGEATQEILRDALDGQNTRKAKKIPSTVYLMEHITCHAILVECGFLSNGTEAALLTSPDYQKKTAAALAGAAMQYIRTIG